MDKTTARKVIKDLAYADADHEGEVSAYVRIEDYEHGRHKGPEAEQIVLAIEVLGVDDAASIYSKHNPYST